MIIDGDPNDKTKEIQINRDKIDVFNSEKDNGIYDAFNKGLDLAQGDLLDLLIQAIILPKVSQFLKNTIILIAMLTSF